jgi:hypothetical protein
MHGDRRARETELLTWAGTDYRLKTKGKAMKCERCGGAGLYVSVRPGPPALVEVPPATAEPRFRLELERCTTCDVLRPWRTWTASEVHDLIVRFAKRFDLQWHSDGEALFKGGRWNE